MRRTASGISRNRKAIAMLAAFASVLAMVLTMGLAPRASAADEQEFEQEFTYGRYWTNLPNGIAPGKYEVRQKVAGEKQWVSVYRIKDGRQIGWYDIVGDAIDGRTVVDVPADTYVSFNNDSATQWRRIQSYPNYGLLDVGSPVVWTKKGRYTFSRIIGGAGQYMVTKTEGRDPSEIQFYTLYDAEGKEVGGFIHDVKDKVTQIVDVPQGATIYFQEGASSTWRKLSQRPAVQRVKDLDGAAHQKEIRRLIQSGISTGWEESDGSVTFRPGQKVVRQDMAAFLYRLAGSPKFTPSAADRNSFWDVTDQTPHHTEIWWLAHNGITRGYSDGSFGGTKTIVRQDMAAFLHRLADYKRVNMRLGAERSFRDVHANTPHRDDIIWLARTGVTTGYPDGTFRGMNPVVRQDMAAFLMRMRDNGVR